jgi:hypothetical protein
MAEDLDTRLNEKIGSKSKIPTRIRAGSATSSPRTWSRVREGQFQRPFHHHDEANLPHVGIEGWFSRIAGLRTAIPASIPHGSHRWYQL